MKKWKNVAATDASGRKCLPVIPRDIDTCDSNMCLSWGDPHVYPFDGGDRTDIYSVGKYIYSQGSL